MKVLELNQQVDQALTKVCNAALAALGVNVMDDVLFIRNSIKDVAPTDASSVPVEGEVIQG